MRKIIIILTLILLATISVVVYEKTQTGTVVSMNNGEQIKIQEDNNSTFPFEERSCFVYRHEGTENEPYTVEEHLEIKRAGERFDGIKIGTQSGPGMTNGYGGTLSGTIKDGQLELVFDYTIEGSENKELEIYTLDGSDLLKNRFVLDEGSYNDQKMLVPIRTSEPTLLRYTAEECK